jgi:hypothetical protein
MYHIVCLKIVLCESVRKIPKHLTMKGIDFGYKYFKNGKNSVTKRHENIATGCP